MRLSLLGRWGGGGGGGEEKGETVGDSLSYSPVHACTSVCACVRVYVCVSFLAVELLRGLGE